jgi:hypothetical protein
MNTKRLVTLAIPLIVTAVTGGMWLRERANIGRAQETAQELQRQIRETTERLTELQQDNRTLSRELAENRLLRQKQIELNTLVPLQPEKVAAPLPEEEAGDPSDIEFKRMLRARRAEIKDSRDVQIRRWASKQMEGVVKYPGPAKSPATDADVTRLTTILRAIMADPDSAVASGPELSEILHRIRPPLLQQQLRNQGLSATEAALRTSELETLWRITSPYGFSILGVTRGERPGGPIQAKL